MKELLQLLCRYPFDAKERERISVLIRNVKDWNEFINLVNAHGIIALAAYNIKTAGLEQLIPTDAMARLENGYLQSVVRNTWLTERWREVNTILTNAGIKHILLKGMALEHTLYGSKGLRQMNDNDILIHPDEALRAWNLLKEEGFTPEMIKSPLHTKIMMEIGKHLPCLYKDGYALEIHERLEGTGHRAQGTEHGAQSTGHRARGTEHRAQGTGPGAKLLPMSVDSFENLVEIMIGSTKAYILSREIHIKYLIDHFERHKAEGSSQFRLYADILNLDKNNKIEIPDSFIMNPNQELEPHYNRAAYRDTFYSIAAKHRLRFLAGDIFPSVKWMKDRYKCTSGRAMLYYPFRVGKLLWLIGKR